MKMRWERRWRDLHSHFLTLALSCWQPKIPELITLQSLICGHSRPDHSSPPRPIWSHPQNPGRKILRMFHRISFRPRLQLLSRTTCSTLNGKGWIRDQATHSVQCWRMNELRRSTETKLGENNGPVPPPLPPRPDETNGPGMARNMYSGYGSGLGGYGSGGYGSMFGMGSPYSSYGACYGMGGYGMNRYGMGGGGYPMASDGDFVRMAEESSRQAFQSIESIVQAFGSVSMMLESTYFAVHSSFRAVLGVADHFSRLRVHLAQILSTLSIVKTVSWFLRRMAFLLRLSDQDPNQESVWREAAKSSIHVTPESVVESLTRPDKKRSSWPIMIFFAVVFGTPWLIWKLLMSISGSSTTPGTSSMFNSQPQFNPNLSQNLNGWKARAIITSESPASTSRPRVLAKFHFRRDRR